MMKVIYEKKPRDFYYRNDRGLVTPLQCNAHLHYHVEIVYLHDGYAKAYVDSDTFEIHSDDLLVIFPNRIHRFEDATEKNKYDLFIVNADIAPEISQRIAAENPQDPVIRNASDNPRVMALINILRDAESFPKSCKQTLLRGYFLSFFAEVLEMMPTRNIKPDENQAIRTVVQYCSNNFTKDLSLSMLENELHLSKYYISHLFGDKLGIRFNDYVNSLRLSEACRMLRTTNMSITEISDASGFGTLRTFNRSFIKQLGTSPSEYRRSNRGDALDVSIPTPTQRAVNPESYIVETDA